MWSLLELLCQEQWLEKMKDVVRMVGTKGIESMQSHHV